MFIPAAGYYNSVQLNNIGYTSYLWTSNLNLFNPNRALFIYIDIFGIDIYDTTRSDGLNVRPVIHL